MSRVVNQVITHRCGCCLQIMLVDVHLELGKIYDCKCGARYRAVLLDPKLAPGKLILCYVPDNRTRVVKGDGIQ